MPSKALSFVLHTPPSLETLRIINIDFCAAVPSAGKLSAVLSDSLHVAEDLTADRPRHKVREWPVYAVVGPNHPGSAVIDRLTSGKGPKEKYATCPLQIYSVLPPVTCFSIPTQCLLNVGAGMYVTARKGGIKNIEYRRRNIERCILNNLMREIHIFLYIIVYIYVCVYIPCQ